MKTKYLYTLLCVGFLILTLTGCSRDTVNIRFGAAGIGGMYYTFATTYAGLLDDDANGFTLDVKDTAGSEANLRLLSDNYIQLGISQNDLIYDAYFGKGEYENKSMTDFSAVAGLYPEVCQLVVRKDSDIQTVNDLQGHTVCIGASESGTERNARQILEVCGLTDSLVDMVNLDYTQSASALQNGDIDAFFCTAGIQTTVIEELTRQCDIRLLGLDDQCRSRLVTAYPFYTEFEIPAGTYKGQDAPVLTLSVQAVLLANNRLSKDTVKKLTAALFTHAQDMQYTIALDVELNESSATSGIEIPFHPGAAAYYQEQGIPVNTN